MIRTATIICTLAFCVETVYADFGNVTVYATDATPCGNTWCRTILDIVLTSHPTAPNFSNIPTSTALVTGGYILDPAPGVRECDIPYPPSATDMSSCFATTVPLLIGKRMTPSGGNPRNALYLAFKSFINGSGYPVYPYLIYTVTKAGETPAKCITTTNGPINFGSITETDANGKSLSSSVSVTCDKPTRLTATFVNNNNGIDVELADNLKAYLFTQNGAGNLPLSLKIEANRPVEIITTAKLASTGKIPGGYFAGFGIVKIEVP